MIADYRASGGRWDDLTTEEKAEHRGWWCNVRAWQIAAFKRGARGG